MSQIKFNTSIKLVADNQTCESRQNIRGVLSEQFPTRVGTIQTENLPVIPFNPEKSKLTEADEPQKQEQQELKVTHTTTEE